MKLNKRERLAFDTLKKILDTYENDVILHISQLEQNVLKEVFNINLYDNTFRKSQVEEFKKGKDKAYLILLNQTREEPFPHAYFPFQIKKNKVKERAEEVARMKEKEKKQEFESTVENLNRIIKIEDRNNKKELFERDLLQAKIFLFNDENLTFDEKETLLNLIMQASI